jgi:arylsulfatase A-like enzyme
LTLNNEAMGEMAQARGSAVSVRAWAAEGCRAWIVYGIVENFFLYVAGGLLAPDFTFPTWQWRLSLVLFGYYGAIGLGLGALGGALARRMGGRGPGAPEPATRRRAAALTVVLAFAVNASLRLSEAGVNGAALLIALALATATLAVLIAPRWAVRLDFATSYWTAALLLVGSSWLIAAFPSWGRAARCALGGGFILAVAGASLLWRRLRSLSWSEVSWIRAGAAGVLVLGAAAWMGRLPGYPRSAQPGPRPAGPNIVWIVMDTVRADRVSAGRNGRDTTPNLRRLAKEATVYSNAIAASNYTLPSHASMLTGLYPSLHGAHYREALPAGSPLDERFTTVAEVLASRGYTTAAVAANYAYLHGSLGLVQGFQYYEAPRNAAFLGAAYPYAVRNLLRPLLSIWVPTDWDLELPYRRAEDINRRVFQILEERGGSDAPLFLFVNYLDAHWPYAPLPPFDKQFAAGCKPLGWYEYVALEDAVLRMERSIEPKEAACLSAQYEGEIAYLDSQLGHLFERLKQLGIYDETLLVVTSDHGEAFGRRNLLSHGVSVYQDQIHVPLIIRYPGQRKGAAIDDYVSLVDLMPTALDAAGQPVPQGLAGRSLIRLDPGAIRHILSESFPRPFFVDRYARFRRAERALFEGPRKLITSTIGQPQLYDLANDPKERVNLWNPANGDAARLVSALQRWLRQAETAPPRNVPGGQAVRQLQSLGYIQ